MKHCIQILGLIWGNYIAMLLLDLSPDFVCPLPNIDTTIFMGNIVPFMKLADIRHLHTVNYNSVGIRLKYTGIAHLLKTNNEDLCDMMVHDLYKKKAALINEYNIWFDEAKKLTIHDLSTEFISKLEYYLWQNKKVAQSMISQLYQLKSIYDKLIARAQPEDKQALKDKLDRHSLEAMQYLLEKHQCTFYAYLDAVLKIHKLVSQFSGNRDNLQKTGNLMRIAYQRIDSAMLVDQLRSALQNHEAIYPLTRVSDQLLWELYCLCFSSEYKSNLTECPLIEWFFEEFTKSLNKYYDQNIVIVHKQLQDAYDNKDPDRHLIREAILLGLRAQIPYCERVD